MWCVGGSSVRLSSPRHIVWLEVTEKGDVLDILLLRNLAKLL